VAACDSDTGMSSYDMLRRSNVLVDSFLLSSLLFDASASASASKYFYDICTMLLICEFI